MGKVGGSKENQSGGRVKRPPNPQLGRGKEKAEISVCTPTQDGTIEVSRRFSGWKAWAPAGPFLYPSHGLRMTVSQGSNARGPLDPFLVPKIKPHRAPYIIHSPPHPGETVLGACITEPEMGMRAERGAPFSTPLSLLRLLHIWTLKLGSLGNEILRFLAQSSPHLQGPTVVTAGILPSPLVYNTPRPERREEVSFPLH